jgi:hypothetical protein
MIGESKEPGGANLCGVGWIGAGRVSEDADPGKV